MVGLALYLFGLVTGAIIAVGSAAVRIRRLEARLALAIWQRNRCCDLLGSEDVVPLGPSREPDACPPSC